MTSFRSGSATDVGRVRSNNQDSLLVIDGQLFAVADGMGGHQGGEVASALALDVLGRALQERNTAALVRAVRSANQAVFERASGDPDLKGMGTTLTAIADVDTRDGERLGIVNVGDSRLYRIRNDPQLEQLTEDHSLVASLVRQGRITPEEAESHPQRNILTRALGIDEAVAVDSWEVDPMPGDRFLLCSDGLFNEVDDNRIAATLRRLEDPADAAQELVRLANEGGGRDNITAVVVDVTAVGTAAVAGGAVPADEPGRTTERHAPIPSDPDEAVAVVAAAESEAAEPVEPRARRFTWRVVVFLLALVVLVGVVVGALGWYARWTYYVAIADEEVVIFQGRPGGFLWFDPTIAQRTGIDVADLPDNAVAGLEAGVDKATLGDAEQYVANIEDQIEAIEQLDREDEATSTTTTTTEPDRGSGRDTPGAGTNPGDG